MKKIAMSVAAATMLVGGLAGCGVDNQAGEGVQQQDFNAQNMTGTNTGYRGQGPVTDMMTPNTRGGLYGQGQFGTNQTRLNQPLGVGRDTAGFLPEGNLTRPGLGRAGLMGTNDTLTAEQGRTRAHQQNITLQNRAGAGTGTGLFGQRTQPGARTGLFGQGTQPGVRTERFGYQQRAGVGHSGLVGNNRPGMVDEDGILKGRARDRAGMLNQRRGQGVMNLQGRQGQSIVNQGVGPNVRTGHTNIGPQTRNQGTQVQQTTMNYHKDYDSRTAQRIVSRVQNMKGVEDARVVVHDDTIVVGIQATDNVQQVKQKVERKVKGLADGKTVHVVTDNDAVGRIRTMDDRLRTGTAFEEVAATFTQMLGDLGRAVQRPFERSR